jgi:uncharacterized protein YqeY
MLEQQIEADIKTALLSGDKERALTLRTVKSVLLNVKVNSGKRDSGLSDSEVLPILGKESKKRQESADFYVQGGAQDRADRELAEKLIIDSYLPPQLSESEVATIIDNVIHEMGVSDLSIMGKVIGAVRAKAGPTADGAQISRLVKEKLS